MNDGPVACWSAGIAPAPLEEHRLPANRWQLTALVHQRGVALRGWNYPHVPRDDSPQGVTGLADGGIEATTATGQYHEVWRLHPNGLFTHRWRLREDGTGYTGTIHFVAAIYTVAEVFEFGRRLYQDDATVSTVTFRITLEDVLNRELSGDSSEDLPYGLRAARNMARHAVEVPRADLGAGILGPSVAAAGSLFSQIGYTIVPPGYVEQKTQEFLSGRV
jgi:hypothetical protein